VIQGSDTDWLNALPTYQRETIQTLLSQGKKVEEVATIWLSASGASNTVPFGSARGWSLFYEKLLAEVETFMCHDDSYASDKKALLKQADVTVVAVVTSISEAIGHAVGAAAPVIAPAIALSLITISRMGRNAWCAMRREQTKAEQDPEH
jgi:hypothetical protein